MYGIFFHPCNNKANSDIKLLMCCNSMLECENEINDIFETTMQDYIVDMESDTDKKNLFENLDPYRVYTISKKDFKDFESVYGEFTESTFLLKHCSVNIIIQEISSIKDSCNVVRELVDLNC